MLQRSSRWSVESIQDLPSTHMSRLLLCLEWSSCQDLTYANN